MKTTKAFLAGLGTSALLVASSLTMLVVFGAVVAVRDFPGPAVAADPPSMVVRIPDARLAAVELTRDDVEAAEAAESAGAAEDAVAGDEGPSAPAIGSSTGFDPGPEVPVVPPEPSPPGRPDPPVDPRGRDGGDGLLPNVDLPGEQLDGVPKVVNNTVQGLDLGGKGRNVTKVLTQGVVAKVTPRLAASLERTVDPLWETADRDR